jgi:hypothetical protein
VNLGEEVATGYVVPGDRHFAAWTPTPPWRLIGAILAGVASLLLAACRYHDLWLFDDQLGR